MMRPKRTCWVGVCRACGENISHRIYMHNLFSQFEGQCLKPYDYTTALEDLTGPISQDDALPQIICETCRKLLKRYYKSFCDVEKIGSIFRESAQRQRESRSLAWRTLEAQQGKSSITPSPQERMTDACKVTPPDFTVTLVVVPKSENTDEDATPDPNSDSIKHEPAEISVYLEEDMEQEPQSGDDDDDDAAASSKLSQVSVQSKYILSGPMEKLVDNILNGQFFSAAKAIMEVPDLAPLVTKEVLNEVVKECKELTSVPFNSILRQTSPSSLEAFKWDTVFTEWKTTAPTFLRFLESASTSTWVSAMTKERTQRKNFAIGMAGATLLKARCGRMSAPMFRNSLILHQAQKKKCFNRSKNHVQGPSKSQAKPKPLSKPLPQTQPQAQPKPLPNPQPQAQPQPFPTTFLLAHPSQPFRTAQNQTVMLSQQNAPLMIFTLPCVKSPAAQSLRQITSIVSVAGAPPKLLQQSVQESSPSMGKEVSQTEDKKQEARTSQGEEQFQESGTTESTPTPTTHCWRKDNDLGPSKTLPQIQPKPLPSLPIPHLLAQPSQPFQITQNQAIRLMLAAQEIYKSVEDTILEYQEEIALRERENDHLRRRLRDAGIEIWPDRQSMALLEEEDGEHPRREWSPSMGHEERVPILIKEKRELRYSQGEDQLRGHGSCSTPESMFTPPRVSNEYPQDPPHSSNLPQNPSVENREREPGPRSSSRHVKSEGSHRGSSSSSSNSGPQPLATVNPNCSNENNIDIIGVENGGQMGSGSKGRAGGSRGQGSHLSNQGANSTSAAECGKSPLQVHVSSFCCRVCGETFSHVGHLHVHVQS
ncbi:unnamed protein product [Coregonus sp. 'balchen']|nr:unnamed protein product [Coregonus sp. 'balchen']